MKFRNKLALPLSLLLLILLSVYSCKKERETLNPVIINQPASLSLADLQKWTKEQLKTHIKFRDAQNIADSSDNGFDLTPLWDQTFYKLDQNNDTIEVLVKCAYGKQLFFSIYAETYLHIYKASSATIKTNILTFESKDFVDLNNFKGIIMRYDLNLDYLKAVKVKNNFIIDSINAPYSLLAGKDIKLRNCDDPGCGDKKSGFWYDIGSFFDGIWDWFGNNCCGGDSGGGEDWSGWGNDNTPPGGNPNNNNQGGGGGGSTNSYVWKPINPTGNKFLDFLNSFLIGLPKNSEPYKYLKDLYTNHSQDFNCLMKFFNSVDGLANNDNTLGNENYNIYLIDDIVTHPPFQKLVALLNDEDAVLFSWIYYYEPIKILNGLTNYSTSNSCSASSFSLSSFVDQTTINQYKPILTKLLSMEETVGFNNSQKEFLKRNKDMVNEIYNFIISKGYNTKSKDYSKFMVDMRIGDSSYRVDRMIELFDIVEANPYSLISDCEETNSEYPISFWSYVSNFEPYQSVKSKLSNLGYNIQRLEDAWGRRVNLDYFAVRVNQLPFKYAGGPRYNAIEFLDYFRRNINSYVNPSLGDFQPIPVDATLWNSTYPLTSIITIKITPDDGSVVCSDFDGDYWTFSTVTAPWYDDGTHPVSGNRQFGISQQSDGTYIVYTKGADRVTKWYHNLLENTGFTNADALWRSLQNNLSLLIPLNGGSVGEKIEKKYRPEWHKIRYQLKSATPMTKINCR